MPAKKQRSTTAAANVATPAQETAFALSDEAVESALLTGEFGGPLEDYFGPELYAELRRLKRDEAARAVRGGPRVLILPGIMGSRLGKRRKFPFDNVYWLDPIDIARGRLFDLRIPRGHAVEPLGAILLYYLKLKLRLRSAGYDADFHAFDWRRSIAELGAELAARIGREGGADLSLVAHSMGGLVARWAIGAGGAKCRRLIMLGTPNGGSYAPVMALRAAYPVVRKVAALDLKRSAEQLASQVFSTFAGLTQMFPARELLGPLDVYDLDAWPADDLRPRQDALDAIDGVRDGYAAGGSNVFMIAGIERETPVGVRAAGAPAAAAPSGFAFEFSSEGDGTVPLAMALLPGAARTYYIAEDHGSLPNNRVVAAAVRDLLDRGETSALPDRWTPPSRRAASVVRHESELRVDPYEGRRGGMLSRRELRHLLDGFASPDSHDEAALAAPAAVSGAAPVAAGEPAGFTHTFDRVVVGRRRQHRIDLRFAFGSVTEVDTRAIALGVFQDVAPSGPARALDARVGGAITELSTRRMFAGGVGEIFMLPTGRHPITAELIAFVGLGAFDRMTDEVLQTAAENVIRTFVRARVEEFATVLFGGGSGESPGNALRNLLTGFFRGLIDADADHTFRRIVLCEFDADRYVQLKQELYRLSSTSLCQDVELTFDEVRLPPPPEVADTRRARVRREDPVYLIVREERVEAPDGSPSRARGRASARRAQPPKEFIVRSSLLTTGGKATIVTGAARVERKAFDAAMRSAVDVDVEDFTAAGIALAEMLLADEVRRVLPRHKSNHLVVVHDAPLSRVPWETLALTAEGADAWFPAADKGISHRYAADNLSVAKWLEERIEDDLLKVLLVVDPTRDLQGARIEGKRVLELFGDRPGCVIDQLYQREATRPALLAALGSGEYDVVHYAGHAFFDPRSPEKSGLLCHNHVALTGADVAGLSKLPALMFFNACESARVREAKRPRTADARKKAAANAVDRRLDHVDDAVGIAEAFMRGGVANFLGTYWPVGDAAAEHFAATFYDHVLRGESLGAAIQSARKDVRELQSRDWADYIFYGDPAFAVKEVGRVRAVREIDVLDGIDV